MRGKWHGFPYKDTALRKYLITFEVDDVPQLFDRTKDKELNIVIK